LPVQLGAERAARTAVAVMVLPQLAVSVLLWTWGLPAHALAVLLLVLAQGPLMLRFVRAPIAKALLLSAFGVPLYVSGMMVSAWGLRQLHSLGAA
jgi:chlorophyll synthase